MSATDFFTVRQRNKRKKHILLITIVLVFLSAVAAVSYYFFSKIKTDIAIEREKEAIILLLAKPRCKSMSLYEKIQFLCKKSGFEISNLGEKIGIGITKGSISKWKNGAVPRANTIKAISDYFGVSVEYLTSDDEDKKTVPGIVPNTVINDTDDEERKLDQEFEKLLSEMTEDEKEMWYNVIKTTIDRRK